MVDDLSLYLRAKYCDGGRDLTGVGVDCWGLVVDAQVRLFNKSPLPSFGNIGAADKRGMTRAMLQLINRDQLHSGSPDRGHIACHFIGKTLQHVGVIVRNDSGLRVLHTSSRWGTRVNTVGDFERLGYTHYYAND